MSFSSPRFLALVLLLVVFAAGCRRSGKRDPHREIRAALREQSFAKASELARHATASAPRDEGAWESLVRAQIGLRDFNNARETLAQWRSQIPHPSARWQERAGDVALRQNDAPLALAAWSEAFRLKPRSVRLLEKMARTHRALQDWPKEDADLSAHLLLEENPTARIGRALCRRRLHRWTEALEDCRRAQDLAPDDPDVRRGARLFQRLEKYLEQIRELDARLALTPEDDQLLADRALLFLRSEDPELALVESEAAAAKAPWAVRPRLFRALAFIALGRASECASLQIDPGLRLANLNPDFLETLGRLDSEISLEPRNAGLLLARAWQLNEIGQPELALRDAQDSLGQEDRSAQAHAESSYALSKLGRGEEALAEIKRATECDPDSGTAWRYRGELEMAREDFAAAIDSLSHSLALEQTATTLQERQFCYMKTGQYQKAEQDHRALEALR